MMVVLGNHSLQRPRTYHVETLSRPQWRQLDRTL